MKPILGRGSLIICGACLVLLGCNGSPTEPSEAGESGTQYQIGDTARETRAGVELVMSYDTGTETFRGTVTNTTSAAVADVRVEIHLSNGVELGPTPRVTLAPGESRAVTLDARGQQFTTWSVHVELGSAAG